MSTGPMGLVAALVADRCDKCSAVNEWDCSK